MIKVFGFSVLFIVFLLNINISAQTKTEETRRTVDSASGQVTVTKSEVISRSEDITDRNNMIILNPLKFFLFYNLSYFGKIDRTMMIGGGLQIPTIKGLNGIGFNAEIRFHPSKKAPSGFYVAPNISYNSLSTDGNIDGAVSSTASIFSIGGLVGWQWFAGDDFAIGLGIGVDYYMLSGSESDKFDNYNGTSPAIRFDIGYAW